MIRRVNIILIFVLISLVSDAVSDCVRYTFEKDFDELFTNELGICKNMDLPPWTIGDYSSLGLSSPNESSKTFITPGRQMSCISSFPFPMREGGTLEVKVYVHDAAITDQITIAISQILMSGNTWVTGTHVHSPLQPSFTTGWYTIRMKVPGPDTQQGFVSIVLTYILNVVDISFERRFFPFMFHK